MDLFTALSLIGSAAFAVSGYVVGIRKQLDLMGLFIAAMLPAYGGGAIRDVLLGQPPAVLSDMSAFYLVCGVVLLSTIFRLGKRQRVEGLGWFIISDSIGLVAFAITGALMGIDAGLSLFGVMVLGFVTAVGGGILRDVLVNETPVVLESDFYGSIALLIGAGLYGLHAIGKDGDMVIAAVFVTALALRLIAYRKGWHLPKLS